MKTYSAKLIEVEKQYGPAELGKDRPENTISVIRAPGSRRKALLATPGIRPDAEFYLHFAKPVDLTLLVKRDIENTRRALTQPPEYISGLSKYASAGPGNPLTRPKQRPQRDKLEEGIPSRPKVDQIGHDLPPNGQVHPVFVGHLPVKAGGPTNQRQRKSTGTLLERALQSMPSPEAHELLLEREIASSRRQIKRQPLAKLRSSSAGRGPQIDR